MRKVRAGDSRGALREQPNRKRAVPEMRIEHKDLTQRARRSEHKGRREERFLTQTPFGLTCGRGSARRGIGDFTKDGGVAGAGGGGKVGGAAVEGFVGQNCEGERFFGGFGDALLWGWGGFDVG